MFRIRPGNKSQFLNDTELAYLLMVRVALKPLNSYLYMISSFDQDLYRIERVLGLKPLLN
jgi:hypothetical protein